MKGACLVQRLDGQGGKFMVNTKDLASFGSNDPESERQIQKRVEYEKVKDLLDEEGYTIAKMDEDGNCLFRAAARQLLGDQEKHLEIRREVVDYIIANKRLFSDYEVNIDERLFEQLMNRSWGGYMEIIAMSMRYGVGIVVWQLSSTGQLVTPINLLKSTASKDPQILRFVRHWGIHYDCVLPKYGNRCWTQARNLSKSRNLKKACCSDALVSAKVTVSPMKLDEDDTSNVGSPDTHSGSIGGDQLVFGSITVSNEGISGSRSLTGITGSSKQNGN